MVFQRFQWIGALDDGDIAGGVVGCQEVGVDDDGGLRLKPNDFSSNNVILLLIIIISENEALISALYFCKLRLLMAIDTMIGSRESPKAMGIEISALLMKGEKISSPVGALLLEGET